MLRSSSSSIPLAFCKKEETGSPELWCFLCLEGQIIAVIPRQPI